MGAYTLIKCFTFENMPAEVYADLVRELEGHPPDVSDYFLPEPEDSWHNDVFCTWLRKQGCVDKEQIILMR